MIEPLLYCKLQGCCLRHRHNLSLLFWKESESEDPNFEISIRILDARSCFCGKSYTNAVGEFANKSAASAASKDYVKFQAVIKSGASAASLRGGRVSGRLDHGFFLHFLAALAAKKYKKIIKISDSHTPLA